MASSPDQPTLPRLLPGQAAGDRPKGAWDWAVFFRRRLRARLRRGGNDVDQLISRGMRVGREVFIGDGSYLDPGFPWLISIGDQSTIGPRVTILTHDATPKLRTGYATVARVRIGERVFVGANATILPGVAVGDDAIVGAGSVVRRDVAPGAIVVGNPAEEVGTTASHNERHLIDIERRPRYPDARNPSPAERERMLEELGDGPGYVG